MRKKTLLLTVLLLACTILSYAAESDLVALQGISAGMNKRQLENSWGFPSKREDKDKAEVWFYLNENTTYPTDGVVVYFRKGKIEKWELVDNIYEKMNIWGKTPGVAR